MHDFIGKDVKKPDSLLQRKKTPNRTGIPDRMKQYFEDNSGFSMSDVRVHYNSDRPAKVLALAYTQGEEVYLGPGQEKHLPHELGHVIQQKEGIVLPTESVNHMPVNSDARLEADADRRSALYQMDCGL
ncbi:MAG: DUF4157 domain-containing protein [Lachnospiraceae bacterium]